MDHETRTWTTAGTVNRKTPTLVPMIVMLPSSAKVRALSSRFEVFVCLCTRVWVYVDMLTYDCAHNVLAVCGSV